MGFDRDVRGKLVLHDGPLPGYEIELIAGEVVIGRDPRVDFTIDHAAVSGRHAFITRHKGAVSIEDLGSTNGTFLNGKRLLGIETLNPGDEIRLGQSIFLHFEAPRVDETMMEENVGLRLAQMLDKATPDRGPAEVPTQVADKEPEVQNTKGALRQGDIVGGDKLSVGDVSSGAILAVGAGARVTTIKQGLSTEDVAELLVDLKRIDHPVVWDGRTPYLGLASFRESDAQFFFGRERLVENLLERMAGSSFIVIYGPSGSGKSSVARAGLFPALRDGKLERSDTWLLGAMLPKSNPIEQLADAMARVAKSPAAGNNVRLEGLTNPLALSRQVEALLTDDPHQRFVLLVDQFEEIFTQTKDEAIRTAFINLLTTAAQAEGGRVIIVISLRSDFIPNCARFPEIWSLMSQQLQLVGAMTPGELDEAITLPAREVGAKIDRELVEQIVTDMKGEPGALPLMSFVLKEMFEVEKTEKGEPVDITLAEYLEHGGIESALERHADQVFENFSDVQKTLARSIFAKLVELEQGGVVTRRTAILQNLIPADSSTEAVKKVVGELAEERVHLITIGEMDREEEVGVEPTSQTYVTLAHEKLIDAWPWLRKLVDQNREIIALQNEIYKDACAWLEDLSSISALVGNTPREAVEGSSDAGGYLYESRQLRKVEEKLGLLQPNLDVLSLRFIEASRALRERRKSEREQ